MNIKQTLEKLEAAGYELKKETYWSAFHRRQMIKSNIRITLCFGDSQGRKGCPLKRIHLLHKGNLGIAVRSKSGNLTARAGTVKINEMSAAKKLSGEIEGVPVTCIGASTHSFIDGKAIA